MIDSKSKQEIIQDLTQVLKQFARLRWEQQKSRRGLTHSERELLGILFINMNNGSATVTPSDLSGMLNITPAGVTHLVNPLEEKGYIQRMQAPDDRRVVLVGLTEKGREFGQVLITEVNEKIKGLVEHLGEEDSKALVRLISSTIEYFAANPIG